MTYLTSAEVWTDINNAANIDEIINILGNSNNDGIKLDQNDLKNLATSQSTFLSGDKPVLLYSGEINTITDTGTVAVNISNNGADFKIIDNTDAAKLASHDVFKDSVLISVDNDLTANNNFFFGENNASGNRTTFGLWDVLSDSFITDNASGHVQVIAPYADPSRTFNQVELQKLLDNPDVTHINGISKADLATNALEKIQYSSVGVLSNLTAAQTGFQDGASMLQADTDRWPSLLDNITKNTAGFTENMLEDMKAAGNSIPAKFLEIAFLFGTVSTVLLAAGQAHASGDYALRDDLFSTAADELGQWVEDNTGGIIGGSIAAAAILGLITLNIVAAPATIVGGAIILGISVLSAVAGDILIEAKSLAEILGIIDTDEHTVSFELNGTEQQIIVNDIYIDGHHVFGNDEWFGFLDGETNLIQGSGNIVGTDEDDLILGGVNGETLNGGDGDDIIIAAGGNDTILGSEGNDTIDGGSGIDTLDYTPLDSYLDNDVTVDLTAGTAHIEYLFKDDDQIIYNIENVTTGGKNFAANDNFRLKVAA